VAPKFSPDQQRSEHSSERDVIWSIAEKLGVPVTQLRQWVRDADLGRNVTRDQRIRDLERELAEANQANEILLEAAGFFPAVLDPPPPT